MNLPSNLFDDNFSTQTLLCQPDKTVIGEILPYNFNAVFRFNTYSEISFSIDRYYNDLFDGTVKLNPYYDFIESLRIIYIYDVGHFIIQDVMEDVSINDSKSVSCFSLEYATGQKYLENFYINTGEEGSVETMYHAQQYGVEYSIDDYYTLVNKELNEFDAYERYYIKEYSNDGEISYNYVETQILNQEDYNKYELELYIKKYPNVRFYWPTKPGLSLLHLIFERIPEWKIGYVDKELWYQERTFSEDRVAVYDFLYNTAADTLDFVIVWDSIHGIVNFYKTTEDGVTADEEIETQWNTDVFISRESLTSSLDIKYSTDDIKTKLKITGGEDLDIRDVNLGQNYVLNLSYYNTPDWLGEDLHLKYNTYADELEKYTTQYSKLISNWSATYNEYNDLMNFVPVEPSVLMIGDEFDKLYCVYTDIEILKKKLNLYKVDQEDSGVRATTAKSDDILLTLTNANEDSIVIRVRYDTDNKENTPSNDNYCIYKTITRADNGLITTIKYSLTDWIHGDLTAKTMELSNCTIKLIGTLGAYLCIAKDETIEENVEAYGIRLLEEKQATYTKIFITQTEGHMSNEGYQCVAQDIDPSIAGEVADGTKWLDTDGDPLVLYERRNSQWVEIEADDEETVSANISNSANYARYIENYNKLQTVQKVLLKKQRQAAYLLNGIAVNTIYLSKQNVNLSNLLRAAALHLIAKNNDVYVTQLGEKQPGSNGEHISEGSLWFYTINNGYALYTTIYQRKNGQWAIVEVDENKLSLTGYDKEYGIATFFVNAEYTQISNTDEYSANEIYFLYKDNEYIKPQIQPTNTDELTSRYECLLSEDISQETKCFFQIEEKIYSFTAPQTIQKNSTLVYNTSTNILVVGMHSIEPKVIEDNTNMTELQFLKVNYYTIKGTEYAVYVNNGIPYVCYARSQGVCLAKMNAIGEASNMNNYFTEQELVRLSPFIREDEYSDGNFLLTGYESEEEQMNIKQELLKAGNEELKKICQPKFSFSTTMANILAIPEFEPIRRQFKLGNFVRVGIREGYVKRARLLEVSINFDNPTDFSATFGDLISTRSEVDKHAELLRQAVTAGKSVASNQSKWQRGADKATEIDNAINEGLKNASLSVGSANGQSITWDQYGIRGRKLIEGTTDEYYDEQFALINNKLAFTTDNWKTSKAVVGEFEVEIPDDNNKMSKQTMYGLLADAVVGGYIQGAEIRGGKLEIGGAKGKFIVHEDGSVEIKTSTGSDVYAQTSAVTAIDAAYKYSIQIIHTGKAVFSTKDDTATLTAKIYRRGVEATDIFKAQNVEVYWEKNPSESNWTPIYVESGNTYSIVLDSNNIHNSAQISCYINPTEEQITEIEKQFTD